MTQQLLTFAKGGEPIKEATSLKDIIIDSAKFVLQGSKSTCSFNFPEQLWLTEVDKGQISQVIQNLVLNASKAMLKGGTINITCENVIFNDSDRPSTLLNEGRHIKISIQDTGVGMSAEEIDKIFDPYYSTSDGGIGLGLAITHTIVSKHNGDILVSSSEGVGTTFTIFLPAVDRIEPEERGELELPPTPSKKYKILVMDDEEMVRKVVKEMLTALDQEVEVVASGEEAISLYEEFFRKNDSFDLVIMDLTIPGGMGGKDAVQEIHKINPEAKVIASSGYHDGPIMANYRDYGFYSAISKPFSLTSLKKIIEH